MGHSNQSFAYMKPLKRVRLAKAVMFKDCPLAKHIFNKFYVHIYCKNGAFRDQLMAMIYLFLLKM